MNLKLSLLLLLPLVLSGCQAPKPDPCDRIWRVKMSVCDFAEKTEQCRIASMKLMQCVEENPEVEED